MRQNQLYKLGNFVPKADQILDRSLYKKYGLASPFFVKR